LIGKKDISSKPEQSPAPGLSLKQLLLLIITGTLASYFPAVIGISWLSVLLFCLWGFINNRIEWVWYCIAASPALEVWARMFQAPYLPYEVGKYFLLLAIVLLLAHNAFRHNFRPVHKAGMLIIILILPGLIVNLATFNYDQWAFNVLGILELAILLIFASRERWHIERFCKTLHFALIPVICMLVNLILAASNFEKIEFQLVSNSQTSGGFGSNQVSTIIGYGILLIIILQKLNRPLFRIAVLNYILLALLIFRGLLTFSRGGMLVGAVAVLIVLMPNIFSSTRSFIRFFVSVCVLGALGTIIFLKVNSLTDNKLLLRYEGETKGTASGYREKTWNTVLAGRENIALSDIYIFRSNIYFGVGPGMAKTKRSDYGVENFAAHTEFTRLLSEHGLGGVGIIIVLTAFPLWWIRRQRILKWKGVICALFALALLTSFHAAMRTNTTIICYILAAIPVFYNTNKPSIESQPENIVHRQ
jgi:hypothetical protein